MEGIAFRQYLIRIAVINWLLSLFKANPELCTYEGLMDELAAWLLSDTCALEGCDNPLLGYISSAFFCCNKHGARAYYANMSDEDKEHRKALEKEHYEANKEKIIASVAAWKKANPEKVKATEKTYRQNMTPEQKAYQKERLKAWGEANRDKINANQQKWRANLTPEQKEELLAVRREAAKNMTPEQRDKINARKRAIRAKKKAERLATLEAE